jgi:AcrR family transcriptional regulator
MSDHRQGPVRSEAARKAILEATARLFLEKGYDHLTMEGIAAEAGVGKQTIYRWWPSRGALVAECLTSGGLTPDSLRPPTTGDLRTDLVSWLVAIFRFAEQPGGDALMRSLIAAAAENEEVGRLLRGILNVDSSLTERLQLAVDAGQLRDDAPLTEIGDALVGGVILRALGRSTAEPDAAERLVDVVLTGLVAPRS